jgi:hypothetical protein
MLQLSIVLLFILAGLSSVVVVGRALRRAWTAAGELRAALAACDRREPAVVRTYAIDRRVVAAARFNRTASAPCALRVAA